MTSSQRQVTPATGIKTRSPKPQALKKKRHPRPQLPLTKRFFTIPEFCLEHRISRSGFYNLQNRGEAPAITKIGFKVLVSAEAAAAWRAKFTLTQ